MDSQFEKKYYSSSISNGWWCISRRGIILNLIKKYASNKENKILEIGCASGELILELEKNGYNNIYGVDVSSVAIEQCKKKQFDVFVMDGTNISAINKKFDIIIASDVLEHIEDDSFALKEWHSCLNPGGVLIVFVPAFMFLWSDHDKYNQHFRRYTQLELNKKLKIVSFEIIKSSYWNFSLFIPVWGIRKILNILDKHHQDSKQLVEPPRIISVILIIILKIENWLLNFLTFPFGISVFSVAKVKEI